MAIRIRITQIIFFVAQSSAVIACKACINKSRSHCPGSIPFRSGEDKPVYRDKPENCSYKKCVLTVTMLSRCSPGFVPGSTTVSSRCRLMFSGFTVKARCRPDSPRCRPGDCRLCSGIENDNNRGEPGLHQGEPYTTGAHRGSPLPNP